MALPTGHRLFPALCRRGTKTAWSRGTIAGKRTSAKFLSSIFRQQTRRILCSAALVLFLLLSGTTASADVTQADSADFRLNTTGTPTGVGGTAQGDSLDFTLNTTSTPTGIGGTAQADSADFTLDTTDTPAGIGGTAQGDSLDFTLNTTGESPGVYADSDDFTLDTRDVIAPTPATLSAFAYLPDNQFQFSVSGASGVNYVIQASTNLSTTNWVSLYTNASPFTFVDTGASNNMQQFYRAVYLP